MTGDSKTGDVIVTLSGGLSDYGNDLSSIVEGFMLSVDAMETTRATYRKVMYLFMDWITETGRSINTLDSTDIIAYKDDLLSQKKSAPTVNLYLSVLRKFYKWAKSSNLYPNITDGVGSVKTRRNVFRKQHLESEEGARLLEHSAEAKVVHAKTGKITRKLNVTEEQIARRNHAMINLMLRTGLRTIEVSRADIGDICRRKGRRILKVWGKGHAEKDDFVVLTDEAYIPVKEYLKTRPGAGPEEPLFACEGLDSKGRRMSTRRIQAICKEELRSIGLDGHEYSAHSLRHTTGTEILLNGGTMFDVQNVLRHSNPATSQIYVNTIMEDKRLVDASESFLDKSFKKKDDKKDE